MVDSGSVDEADGDGGSVSRRRFVRAASAAGVTTGLAGCVYGGSDGGGGGTVVWGFDPTAAQEAGEEIKQAFYDAGLSKDIDIEFSTGGAETGSRRDSYNTLLNAGETDPDMFMMDNGWTNIFIARQQLANLSETLPDEAVATVDEEYFQGFTATARGSGGDLFGVPLFPAFPTMQYRKDWAEAAGYSPESDDWATEPMTWQEFSQITKEVKEQQGSKYGYTFQFDIYEGLSCCDFNEFITSWGGAYFGGRENLFGPVGERPVTVDTEPVKDALRMIRTFVHGRDDPEALEGYAGGIAPSEVLSMNEESSRKPMLNGDAAMHRNWPYALSLNGAADALGEDYGAMPIPYAVSEGEAAAQGTGGTASALGGWHMTVNPDTENEEAVREVISTHVTSDQLKLDILEIFGWLPTKPELFNSSRAREVEPIGRYMDTLKVAGENVIARPVTAVWGSQSSAIAQRANAVAAQKETPSEGMGQLEGKLQDIESGYEG